MVIKLTICNYVIFRSFTILVNSISNNYVLFIYYYCTNLKSMLEIFSVKIYSAKLSILYIFLEVNGNNS